MTAARMTAAIRVAKRCAGRAAGEGILRMACVVAVFPAAATRMEAGFVRSRIQADSRILDVVAGDLNGDGAGDLLLVLLDGQGRRRLAWYLQRRGEARFESSPDGTLAVPPDVVAFSVHDVREDPGKEILLLTRGGVFSLSASRSGLRGNLRRELSLPLFPDLALPHDLPRWTLEADVDGDGAEEILLLSEGILLAFSSAGPAPGDGGGGASQGKGPSLVPVARWHARKRRDPGSRAPVDFDLGGSGRLETRRPAFLAGLPSSRPDFSSTMFLSREVAWVLPALVAWDGRDGFLDAVFLEKGQLAIYGRDPMPGEGVGSRSPSGAGRRAVALPPGGEDSQAKPRFVDLDGDGRQELVLTEDLEGGKEHVVRVHLREEEGGVREEPSARIKLSGMGADFHFEDVDGDGFLDCVARVFDVPLSLAVAPGGLRIQVTLMIFRGGAGAALSRHPDLRLERRVRPEDLSHPEEALLQDLSGDFDGDGVHDLLSVSPSGVLEIHRLEKTRGGSLRLAKDSLSEYRLGKDVAGVSVVDLTPDAVSDLMLRGEESVEVIVSRVGSVEGGMR